LKDQSIQAFQVPSSDSTTTNGREGNGDRFHGVVEGESALLRVNYSCGEIYVTLTLTKVSSVQEYEQAHDQWLN
jgi:hypothetical protein